MRKEDPSIGVFSRDRLAESTGICWIDNRGHMMIYVLAENKVLVRNEVKLKVVRWPKQRPQQVLSRIPAGYPGRSRAAASVDAGTVSGSRQVTRSPSRDDRADVTRPAHEEASSLGSSCAPRPPGCIMGVQEETVVDQIRKPL
ncbi:hypothetical protein DENSPDRAFT_152476 [Dentipellis sp. KUC8613]|nr:hypothetical protein DENSPDRAFT_152476 [Dentipellis sp. KUC8613]